VAWDNARGILRIQPRSERSNSAGFKQAVAYRLGQSTPDFAEPKACRRISIAETVPVSEPESHATEKVRKGETVAYTWYWTKDGKIAGLYIRKSSTQADLFTLEEPDGTVHVGGKEDIAGKYVAADLKLRRDGLRRSSVMNSGTLPEFNLP
jgi:hypothetical protein